MHFKPVLNQTVQYGMIALTMGRTKLFNRAEVLEKAMPLFWKLGFAATGLQELEAATGVNKSGIYSEFKNKEDLFLSSLKYYYEKRDGSALLLKEPLGWDNIDAYFKRMVQFSGGDEKGCFGINCLRELGQLTPEAQRLMIERKDRLKSLFIKNIAAEKTKTTPDTIGEILSTFVAGVCIEQNLKISKTALNRKLEDFMIVLRLM